jgi:hypothetical protein
MKNYLLGIGLLLSMFCFGCLDTPVPPYLEKDVISDDKIIGQWIPVKPPEDDETPVYTVVPEGNNSYRLLTKENNRESLAQLTLYRLNDKTYLTVKYADDETYDTFQYAWKGETLTLIGFEEQQFIDLSKKEKLDLEYRIDEDTANGPFVAFESSSEKIRNFLQAHGAQVFTEKPIEFQRIDL